MALHSSDHLANERTFLAWIRTTISLIVFGFVVAKFGVTLRQFLGSNEKLLQQSGISFEIGLVFMLVGMALSAAAWFRYNSTRTRIEAGDFRPSGPLTTTLAIVTIVFGGILAGYLMYTQSLF